MKEGWEYKKLGEVGKVLTGSTPSTKDPENYDSHDFCFVKPSDIPNIGTSVLVNTEFYISKKAFTSSRQLPKGSVLTTCIGIIGKVGILGIEATCNQQINAIIPYPNTILSSFLAYSILSKRNFLEEKANAPVVPIINKKEFSNTIIGVPPLSEQQRIVEELDLLSSIIEKKKAQLKELDNLAQSIFYDMFGDPVTNEKGWEVKKLKTVSTLLNGRAYKQHELLSEGKYKVLRVGNFFTNSNYYYSDLELEDDKYCDYGDLLFAWSASFGAFIWKGGKVIYHYHIWKVLYDDTVLNILFFKYLLNIMTQSFMKDVHGIGMVHLTKVGMEQYMLPIPPLELQQQFAEKIVAIEHQKELIKQSIKEVETLFNSRMDYYFDG